LLGATIIESKPIDQRSIARQTEETRRGIAGLRVAGDSANFDKAEPKRAERIGCFAIFVEAGGQADRVAKRQTKPLQVSKGQALMSPRDPTTHEIRFHSS
jgi:hypothetical protein